MTRQEQLNNWLGDRQRSYADGLVLFDALAKESMKQKFATYFEKAPESPHIFDPHFTQLVNCLTRIFREINESPSLYPAAMEEIIAVKTLDEKQRTDEIEERKQLVTFLESEIEELNGRIESLEGDSDDHAGEIADLQQQVEENLTQLGELRKEMDALNTPGVKIISEESLTPALRRSYARIKEIAPLYASLHAGVANPDIPVEERQALADELCKLDDERRRLWKGIDDYAEGKGADLQLDAERPAFSENSIVRGIEIARQIKRLKQNITNSRIAADRAQADNRQVVYDNAMARIARYEAELSELEKEVSTANGNSGEKVSG